MNNSELSSKRRKGGRSLNAEEEAGKDQVIGKRVCNYRTESEGKENSARAGAVAQCIRACLACMRLQGA